MGVVAYLAFSVAVSALALCHQGQPFPLARAWAWVAAWRAGRRSRGSRVTPIPLRRSSARTARPAPAWARTDEQEAA